MEEYLVMSKLNFAQTMPASRDIGGISSKVVLIAAICIAVAWSILMYARS